MRTQARTWLENGLGINCKVAAQRSENVKLKILIKIKIKHESQSVPRYSDVICSGDKQ